MSAPRSYRSLITPSRWPGPVWHRMRFVCPPPEPNPYRTTILRSIGTRDHSQTSAWSMQAASALLSRLMSPVTSTT